MGTQVSAVLRDNTAFLVLKTLDDEFQTDVDTGSVQVTVKRKGRVIEGPTTINQSQLPGRYVHEWDTSNTSPGTVDIVWTWTLNGAKGKEVLKDFPITRE